MNDIFVSISCITYNHENYIVDALEGFLMQKTNYRFEILIHDDASTDKTAEIIREYEKKYPDLIKSIYQTENQYSKGVVVSELNRRRALGKYIAICEGDDYWIDPFKLQKQIDFMEKNPQCSMYFHDAELVDEDKTYLGSFPGTYLRSSGIKRINELVFIPTASKVFRSTIMNSENIPDWYYKTPHKDFSGTLICSNYGKIFYLNEKMSAYRTNVPVSIMYKEKIKFNNKPSLFVEYIKKRINELEEYDKWSNHKNSELVKKMILEEEFKLSTAKRDFKELRQKKFKPIFDELSCWETIKAYARVLIPRDLYLILHRIKNIIFKVLIVK